MGGFGALMIGLKNPDEYCAISAFAPLCNLETALIKDTFFNYLGEDTSLLDVNPCELIKTIEERAKKNTKIPILIDQGADDEYRDWLGLECFINACEESKYDNVTINIHKGYDHSYYFVRTFVMQHFLFHENHFNNN